MIQLSKQADYGMVIMAYLARSNDFGLQSSSQISKATKVSNAMTAKILKILTNHKLLSSTQGSKGGYMLNGSAQNMTLVDILEALDEPVALTQCSSDEVLSCSIQDNCSVKPHWTIISQSIKETLSNLTLQDLINDSLHIYAKTSTNAPLTNTASLPMNSDD